MPSLPKNVSTGLKKRDKKKDEKLGVLTHI